MPLYISDKFLQLHQTIWKVLILYIKLAECGPEWDYLVWPMKNGIRRILMDQIICLTRATAQHWCVKVNVVTPLLAIQGSLEVSFVTLVPWIRSICSSRLANTPDMRLRFPIPACICAASKICTNGAYFTSAWTFSSMLQRLFLFQALWVASPLVVLHNLVAYSCWHAGQ